MLKIGDKIGIVCCSNGQKQAYEEKIKYLEDTLKEIGLQPVFSNHIYEKEAVFSGTAQERAEALMRFYKDNEIKAIFDISGGDVANGVLPYLDYEFIANSEKIFWGYSDLTTIINAIYAKTGNPSVLYQIRNLIYHCRDQQIADFQNTVVQNGTELFQLKYKFIQKNYMQGIVVGGNIRCFLKLAGTEYMPDLTGKILLLESFGGTVAKVETYLCQLQQMGVFDKVAGLLLGTFTEMEQEQCLPTVETLVKRIVGEDLPIAVTREIGHGTDSKGIVIGKKLKLKEEEDKEMENKKVLVAFFSHTGENYFPGGLRCIEKGNTHIAAEMIAEVCDGALFEIKTVNEYSDVYKECVEQAKTEYGANARPELKEDIDISGYDMIFVGYPNWCGTMPMPVWTFLENHDFTGKVVCPFCTNEGSGLANSVKDMEALIPTAVQKTGLSIKGSQVQEAMPAIKEWVETLG